MQNTTKQNYPGSVAA